MEFIKINYWRNRSVLIDGQQAGVTNRVLVVGQGRHRFELSAPKNYSPSQQIKTVSNTTRQRPLEITFLHESRQ